MLFSANPAEATAALHELLQWSALKPAESAASAPCGAQPTPMLVLSLARFVASSARRWRAGPSLRPAIAALAVLENLVCAGDSRQALANASIIASCAEAVELLLRLSLLTRSPLARHAQCVLAPVAKFCDLSQCAGALAVLCASFPLLDPAEEEANAVVFLHFALLPGNCRLLLARLGARALLAKLVQLLAFPSTGLRDTALEFVFLCCALVPDFKDAVCGSQAALRALLALAVPPFSPFPAKDALPFTPCQKACVLLLELCDDARAVGFLAQFKFQVAEAVLHWRSCALPKLAMKLANVSSH